MIKILLLILLVACTPEERSTQKTTQVMPDQSQAIALLNNFSNSVQIKKRNELNWSNAVKQYAFGSYDMLKTGNNSKALVLYKDQSKLSVEENSFVIIVESKNKSSNHIKVIDLNQGIINGEIKKLTDKENILEIRTKSGLLKIKAREVNENKFKVELKESGELVVNNQQASIQVVSHDKIKDLSLGEEFIVGAGIYSLNKKNNLPEVNLKNWGIKKNKVKKVLSAKQNDIFLINYPKNEQTIKSDAVIVEGKLRGYKVLLNGKKIISKSGIFSQKVKLNIGLNILTFQIIHKEDVSYKVIKVYRK